MGEAGSVQIVCPSCAGTLGVGAAHDILVCGSCGTSFKVERSGDDVTLEEVTGTLATLRRGADTTASSLALARLSSELQVAEGQLLAHERHIAGVASVFDGKIRSAGRAGPRVVLRASLAAAGTFLAAYVLIIIPYLLSHPGYEASPLWYRISAGGTATVVAIVVVTIVLRRSAARRRAAVAVLEAERAAALEAAAAPGPALTARVEALRERIAENRRILES